MFWKKKTKKKRNDLIDHDFNTRRESFRLQSEAMGPAVAVYNDDLLVEMVDISAGGIGFKLEGCHQNETGTIHIELPGNTIQSITLPVIIVHITDNNICHCKFIKIDHESEEKIHKYILFRQIVTQRKLRSKNKLKE